MEDIKFIKVGTPVLEPQGLYLSADEARILKRLLAGYLVGPTATAVILKLRAF